MTAVARMCRNRAVSFGEQNSREMPSVIERNPASGMREGDIDLLLASPECSNHSPAKVSKPRCERSRRTSHYVLNFAKRLKPRWIVLENVVQLRSWKGYDPLIADLRNVGYRVRPQILDAVEFGVPQTRRRLFVLCDQDKEPPPVKSRKRKRHVAEDVIRLDGR